MMMRKGLNLWVLGLGLLVGAEAALLGCGNGGGVSVIGISPTPTATMDAGQTLPLLISVVNDPQHLGASVQLVGDGTLGTPVLTPNGTSTNETVKYTAPSQVSAVDTVSVSATSRRTTSQSVTTVITINPALVIGTTSLPNGIVGTAYSATVSATGGGGTIQYALSSGSLPPGIGSITTAGSLVGTPTTAGSYTFSVTATDGSIVTTGTTQSYTVNVAPIVTTTTLPNGVIGTAYSQQLAFAGGTTGTFSVATGVLPSWLSLSAGGALTGTPTTANAGQTYTFGVAVSVNGQTSAPVTLTISVPALPAVTTTSLPSGNVGVAYSTQLSYSGGNGGAVSWALAPTTALAGSGLTLSTSGLLSGTPTTATTYSFSVTVTIGGQTSAAQALTLVINSLIVTSGTSARGEIGLPFSFQLTAAGGTGPYTWSLASGSAALPTGLSLNTTSGLITGAPTTAASTAGVVVQAKDSLGATATQSMTFVISAARAATLNSELNGQYAFLLTGFDSAGNPLASAGKFVADGNGNITSGVVDTNGTALAAPVTNATLLASTYSVGADGRGKLTLTTSSGSVSYLVSLGGVTSGVAGSGYMNEFDATGQKLTGSLALQTPAAFTTASLVGGYAFGTAGFATGATTSTLRHRSLAGEVQLTGAGASSSAELLSSASLTTTPTIPTSTAIAIGTNGRGTLVFTLPNAGGTLSYAVYVVSATKVFLVSTAGASGTSGSDLLSGIALQQTTGNGNFTTASLNSTAVMQMEKVKPLTSGGYAPDILLGLAASNGTGRITYVADENNAGVITSDSLAGTYTVAANGRVALTLSAGLGGCTDCTSTQTFFYLVGANQGFVMDFSTAAVSGYFEPQTGSAFTAASVTGGYATGTQVPLNSSAAVATSEWTSNGVSAITGTSDVNASPTLTPDATVSSSYAVSSAGRVTLTSSSGDALAGYVVSPTKVDYLDITAASPVLSESVHQ